MNRINSFEGDRYILGELHEQSPQHYSAWYAIWDNSDPNPESSPIATFPFGPEGWAQAWQYFIEFEPSPRPVPRPQFDATQGPKFDPTQGPKFDPTGVRTSEPTTSIPPGYAPPQGFNQPSTWGATSAGPGAGPPRGPYQPTWGTSFPNGPNSNGASGVEVAFEGPTKQRRLTVAFRIILAVPQLFVLWALTVALFVLGVISWFAALFTGAVPDGLAEFMRSVVIYNGRVSGYLALLTDRYPPFTLALVPYPIYIEIYSSRLNRLAVFFRIILVIPAYLLISLMGVGLEILFIITWVIVLVAGQMPDVIYRAIASITRYQMRLGAYFFMLTSTYPFGLFGDSDIAPDQYRRPLILPTGSIVIISICIAIGVLQFILSHFQHGGIVTPGPHPVWL